ncbi:MAG: double-strand break repair helicase AddA [Bdellovibrionales bacterium]
MSELTQPQEELYDVNRQQRKASDPAQSVWVSASAGSGKTKVLSDRMIRLLLKGVPPQKILCLTFTKAAAAEMSIRLTTRLSQWAVCDDATLEDELHNLQGYAIQEGQRARARQLFARILSCPGGLRVQTIHSFAQEVLRRFPLEAGLSPHFKVLEENDARELRQEVIQDLLQDMALHKESELGRAMARLVSSLGEFGFSSHLSAVLENAEKWPQLLEREGGFEALAKRIAAKMGVDTDQDEDALTASFCSERENDFKSLRGVANLLLEKGSEAYKKSAETVLTWLEAREKERTETLDDYKKVFLTFENEIRKVLFNKKLGDDFPHLKDVLESEALRVFEFVLRVETSRTYHEGMALMRIGLRVMEDYQRRKRQKAALDYDDLILKTRDLLQKADMAPWVLYKLDGGVSHILLDEAQDTNPAQWDIVKALADEFFAGEGDERKIGNTLFVVGDEKQSIYSFLKADPAEFERRHIYFKNKIESSACFFKDVPLHMSFRSAPAILRAVDEVFAAPANQQGVSHTPIKHYAFREKAAGKVMVLDLIPAQKKQRLTSPEDWHLPRDYQSILKPNVELADRLARKVRDLIQEGRAIYDSKLKTMRPLEARDVMLLVRSRKGIADQLVKAFKQYRVPISGVDKMLLTGQLPVMDLAALMAFTLLPEDDLNLACVLRGPLLGISERELERLAIDRGKLSLWQSLLAQAETTPRFVAFKEYLERVMRWADHSDPCALLIKILTQGCPCDEHSGRRALLARLGPQAEDPIDELLNQAENFVMMKGGSLQAFLHDLSSTPVEIKRELEQDMDCVRITTVHGAKGLEAPFVILPDTTSVPRTTDLPKILWDDVSGLPFYVPRSPKGGFVKELHEQARYLQIEEYRRLLYVALTRPADWLLVCGYEPEKKSRDVQSWYDLVSEALAPHRAEEGAPIIMQDYAADEVLPRERKDEERRLPLPAWLWEPPPAEPSPPRPLVPSHPSQDEEESQGTLASPRDVRLKRGRLLHKLLQYLPDVPDSQRAEALTRFLALPQHKIEVEDQRAMFAEVMGIIEDARFAPLFGRESKAEVPLIGLSGDNLIAGQVDRLALVGDEVWLVDYKTNRPPPRNVESVPSLYRNQMAAYRKVLAAIYPDKRIRCFLLWTYELRLMELE